MASVANWKNKNEYPKWNAASLKRVAWEFLRRNPDYQADWHEYLAACRRLAPDFDPHANRDWGAELWEHDDYFYYDPPRLEGENNIAWMARVNQGTRTPLHSWYARKWGLKQNFPDPFYPYYEKHGERSSLAIRFEKSASKAEVVTKHWRYFENENLPSREPQQALAFDYSMPIEPQLTAAKKYLLMHQRTLVREGIVKEFPDKTPRMILIDYLRMLDADADGIKQKDIAAVFFPGQDSYPERRASNRVSKAINKAKEWRDNWYRLWVARRTLCVADASAGFFAAGGYACTRTSKGSKTPRARR